MTKERLSGELGMTLDAWHKLHEENKRLRVALRYWLPDETLIPKGHEIAWNEHVALIPEHRRSDEPSVVRTTPWGTQAAIPPNQADYTIWRCPACGKKFEFVPTADEHSCRTTNPGECPSVKSGAVKFHCQCGGTGYMVRLKTDDFTVESPFDRVPCSECIQNGRPSVKSSE